MIIELKENKVIDLSLYNGRVFLLKAEPSQVKISKILNIITELEFTTNFFIKQGDVFPLISDCDTKTVFKIKTINIVSESNREVIFSISCDRINKTSHWILPFVGKNEGYFGYDTVMINSYIASSIPELSMYNNNGYVFIRYRYLKDYDPFFINLKESPNFVELDIYFNNFEYLYTFKIPDNFRDDTQLIINGDYSVISDKAKKKILSFHNLQISGKTFNILYKAKEYKEELQSDLKINCDMIELESKFNINSETLNK